ncbi:hypothetical protein E2986_09903 [Frieseomelitta varia]|uniref:Uncharacterized protein n=1 Tax=Frieseomelitta varia TaxID=561572 RepID=A0A833RE93_9HYME|nr:hypothetical protein E2986_09903 [Frieseomelitta varia]
MNLRNVLNDALFLLLLNLTSSFLQVITEVDVPELQLLASNLKPEECVKLVSLDSDTCEVFLNADDVYLTARLSEAQIEKLAREQNCFRRLVKWVCHLKTVTRNTYPILNSLLERIGRRDLIACLAELSTKTSKSPKVIREARTDDPDKFIEDARDVSRSYFVRKPRAKRKRPPSYEMVHTATENATVAAPPPKEEPEEPELPACYRCFKKKRKKSTRRPNR